MLKIVLYSMDYGDTVVRTLPYVHYLSERGLHHLSDLQRRDTRIVLITPANLDPYILDYHFRELYQLDEAQAREALGRLIVITPAPKTGRSLGERVLMDPKTLERLDEERKKASAVELINYAPSPASETLAAQLGVEREEGPYRLSLRWGSKSGSKEIFRIADVPTPTGSSTVFKSGKDLESRVLQMAQSTPPPRRLVIKLNDPSWGNAIGNAVIDCGYDRLSPSSDYRDSQGDSRHGRSRRMGRPLATLPSTKSKFP
ncbi:MAG: hypothetical protein ACRDR6_12410 [Pseudonocardiaceae bacterium]